MCVECNSSSPNKRSPKVRFSDFLTLPWELSNEFHSLTKITFSTCDICAGNFIMRKVFTLCVHEATTTSTNDVSCRTCHDGKGILRVKMSNLTNFTTLHLLQATISSSFSHFFFSPQTKLIFFSRVSSNSMLRRRVYCWRVLFFFMMRDETASLQPTTDRAPTHTHTRASHWWKEKE